VPLLGIEAALNELWRSSGADQAPSDRATTRACMSNLIVYCDAGDGCAQIEQQLPDIARTHPSRILLLTEERDSDQSEILASVSTFSATTGSKKRIRSEHVTLRARGAASRELAGIVRPLLIGDLPTALWWTPSDQPPPRGGERFRSLATMADRIIYDSRGWLNPLEGVLATASWVRESVEQLIFDIAWARLDAWRRLIAQTLDPALAPGALQGIRSIDIEHGPHAFPAAWLLVGWLAHSLGWRPGESRSSPGARVTWEFISANGPVAVTVLRKEDGDPEIYAASIRWYTQGADFEEHFERLAGDRLGIKGGASRDSVRVMAIPERSQGALVAHLLPNRSDQSLFRASLEASAAMARTLSR
jgi:glucose-6-phosphate dehydrogenase assembly protein OpcA